MELNSKYQLAGEKIRAAKRLLLVSHTSPDADAISSLAAVYEVSAGAGREVYAFADKKPENVFSFIPHDSSIRSSAPADISEYDVILILDCGSIARTALEGPIRTIIEEERSGRRARRPYIIEFDHHQPIETYADLEIRLPEMASTTQIIYHFLVSNGLEINKVLADCILIGLVTDTGHFLHANSSREAIAVASEMLLRGASLPKIISRTVNNKSFLALKVWGRVLENMHFDQETGLASSGLTEEELAHLATREQIAEGDLFGDIVSFLSTLAGVRVSLLLREEEGVVKGSLRTTDDDIDVAAIAQKLGGGGHKRAAGFSAPGKLVRTETGWRINK